MTPAELVSAACLGLLLIAGGAAAYLLELRAERAAALPRWSERELLAPVAQWVAEAEAKAEKEWRA